MPSREITKGAIVSHEVLHSIATEKISTMILKLDMMKEYDRVNWDFLISVLK